MSIAEKITRLNTAKNDIATAITNKGVEVSENDGFENFAALIDSIEAGGGSVKVLDVLAQSTKSVSGTSSSVLTQEMTYYFTLNGTPLDDDITVSESPCNIYMYCQASTSKYYAGKAGFEDITSFRYYRSSNMVEIKIRANPNRSIWEMSVRPGHTTKIGVVYKADI